MVSKCCCGKNKDKPETTRRPVRPRAGGPGAGFGDAGGAGASGLCSAGGGGVGAARAGAGGGANDAAGTGDGARIMHFGVPTAVPLCRAKTHRNTYTNILCPRRSKIYAPRETKFMPEAIRNLRPK